MKRTFAIFSSVLIATLVILGIFLFISADNSLSAVYISNSGNDSNNGESAATPIKSISRAYELLGGDGTIVVSGNLTVSSSVAKLPQSNGKITLTSVYGGVDFRESGARLSLSTHLYIGSDMEIKDIYIHQSSSPIIFCCGNNVRFGDGITTNTSSRAPSIFGGTNLTTSATSNTYLTAQYSDFQIEICSGTWYTFNGGFYRNTESNLTGVVGDLRVVINGGKFTAAGNETQKTDVLGSDVLCGAGAAALLGDLHLEINGGEFNSSIFALGHPTMNSTKRLCGYIGDVYVEINGGTFKGKNLGIIEESTYLLEGNCYLSVNGGSFSSLSSIRATGVLGTAYQTVPESLESKLVDFSPNIYVSNSGNDSASGTASSPVKSISRAITLLKETGGRIVICNEVSAKGALPSSEKQITITSKTASRDYTSAGKLVLNGELTLGADTAIEDLRISATSASTINANGHHLRIGKIKEHVGARFIGVDDVVTSGTIDIDAKESANGANSIILMSGTYRNVRGGHSPDGCSVVIGGGKVSSTIYGASGKKSVGTATVRIDGGEISADIYATEKGSSDVVGVSILGGNITSKKIAASKSGKAESFSIGLYGGSIGSSVSFDTSSSKSTSVHSTDKYSSLLPAKAQRENIIYVSDNATGDGSSPLSPMGGFFEAIAKCTSAKTKVVFVSDASVNKVAVLGAKAPITLSTFGGGCNFAISNSAKLTLKGGFELSSNTTLDRLEVFLFENDTFIACNGNSLLVTESVNMTSSYVRRVERDLSVYGGARVGGAGNTGTKPVKIELYNGLYYKVYGGNIRKNSAASSLHTINGNIELSIYGGTYSGGVFLNGENDLAGDGVLNIYAGLFNCPVFAASSVYSAPTNQKTTVRGDLTINVYGGEFRAELDAVQDSSVTLNGTYKLKIENADLDRVSTITGAESIGAHSELELSDKLKTDEKINKKISFTNNVGGYPDPSVVLANDGYYYYSYSENVEGKPAIFMKKALNLCDIASAAPKLVWKVTDGTAGSNIESIWAPQLYQFDGKWYMYATCAYSASVSANRKPYVWVGADTPSDGFEFFGVMEGVEPERFYASPRFLEWNGSRYLICGSSQTIIITKTASPTKLSGTPTVIASYTESFEAKILEGPVPLISPNGTLYVAYAAGHTRLEEYCTGLLKFNGAKTDDVLNASLWYKYKEPLHFANTDNRVFSPGAMIFVTSPDGSETWCVYHAKSYTNAGFTFRRLHLQPLRWENDLPVIDTPPSTYTVLNITANSKSVDERISGFDKIKRIENSTSDEELPPATDPPVTDDVTTNAPDTNDAVSDTDTAETSQADSTPTDSKPQGEDTTTDSEYVTDTTDKSDGESTTNIPKPSTKNEPVTDTDTSSDTTSENGALIICVIAIAILCASIILLVILKKKKR